MAWGRKSCWVLFDLCCHRQVLAVPWYQGRPSNLHRTHILSFTAVVAWQFIMSTSTGATTFLTQLELLVFLGAVICPIEFSSQATRSKRHASRSINETLNSCSRLGTTPASLSWTTERLLHLFLSYCGMVLAGTSACPSLSHRKYRRGGTGFGWDFSEILGSVDYDKCVFVIKGWCRGNTNDVSSTLHPFYDSGPASLT